jgi:hypothetical protein
MPDIVDERSCIIEEFCEEDAVRAQLDQLRGLSLPKTAEYAPTLTRKEKMDRALET